MIEKPANLSEQLQNLVERLAQYLKERYTKTEVDTKFEAIKSGDMVVLHATNADSAKTATKATNADNATAAGKLKTAVTINDTSFDGTINIVTSKWGTARNITIKSGTNTKVTSNVDGHADFTLELPATLAADISGTAAKATADASGNNIAAQYLSKGDAESTYLTKTEASSTYATSSTVTGSYVSNEYLTTELAKYAQTASMTSAIATAKQGVLDTLSEQCQAVVDTYK